MKCCMMMNSVYLEFVHQSYTARYSAQTMAELLSYEHSLEQVIKEIIVSKDSS